MQTAGQVRAAIGHAGGWRGLSVGLVVILVAAASGCGGDGAAQERAEVLDYLRQANAAVADDDPAGARSLLAEIDEGVIEDKPDLVRRVVRARKLARLAERYMAARALGDSGSYLAARQEMLSISPFRNAKAKAHGYAALGARNLVSQARDVYESRLGRALGLLDHAERLAPRLATIDAVRSLAASRQQARAAPPPIPTPPPQPTPTPPPEAAPTPEPAPAPPSCDPNYTGACIPSVSYDLDCGDIGAVDFSSVGSDSHGFDREGEGLACES